MFEHAMNKSQLERVAPLPYFSSVKGAGPGTRVLLVAIQPRLLCYLMQTKKSSLLRTMYVQ